MKKIKLFLVMLVCVLVMCPLFAGCSGGAKYVKNSSKFSYSYTYSYLHIDYQFKVDTRAKGNYKIEFDIEIYEGNTSKSNLLETVSESKEFSSEGNGVNLINGSAYAALGEESTHLKFALNHIKIKKLKDKNDFKGYAIGFGVVGGLLLCGITEFFIIDKLVISKKKDK